MSKLQKHIWTFIQTDFNPVKTNFNQITVPALDEIHPPQPKLVFDNNCD